MGLGAQMARRLLLGDVLGHQIAVFTVTAHHGPLRRRGLQDLIDDPVGEAQVVVGHVDLVGGDTGGGHVLQLGLDAGVPVLDGHVEAVVAAGHPVGPAVPGLQGGGQGAAPLALGEVQHRGGAPGQGGHGAGPPVVGGLVGQALVHLEVGVGVDEAGEDQLPGGVRHLGIPGGQVGTDLGDPAAVHAQVGLDGALGQHQGAVLDEDRHRDDLLFHVSTKTGSHPDRAVKMEARARGTSLQLLGKIQRKMAHSATGTASFSREETTSMTVK